MSDVLTHRGAQVVTRAELARIPTPVGTWTHKPVAHAELVDVLTSRLQERGLAITHEKLTVSANGMQIFGVLDFENGIALPGLGRAMGFHAANDKTLSINIVAGVTVFCCDNLSLSGSAIVMKRKHSRNLSLASEINLALDRFETGRRVFEQSVERLQVRAISDDRAKVAIFDMVYTGVLGQSLFDEVAQNYFKAEDRGLEDSRPRTAWGVAVPDHLRPGPLLRAGRGVGRRCGDGNHRDHLRGWARRVRGPRPLLEPVDRSIVLPAPHGRTPLPRSYHQRFRARGSRAGSPTVWVPTRYWRGSWTFSGSYTCRALSRGCHDPRRSDRALPADRDQGPCHAGSGRRCPAR